MPTVAFTTLHNEVLPFVADCPALLATHALRNAAIEFCHKTQLWTYDVAAADIVAGTAAYVPTLPDETVLVEVLTLWHNDKIIYGRSQDELTNAYRLVDWREKTGDPQYYYRDVPSTIVLVPNPTTSVTGGLEMRVSLAPSRAGTVVDSEIAERYAELLGIGARARLHSLAGQPFFNPSAAATNERLFRSGITDARIKANRGQARVQQAVSFNGGFL